MIELTREDIEFELSHIAQDVEEASVILGSESILQKLNYLCSLTLTQLFVFNDMIETAKRITSKTIFSEYDGIFADVYLKRRSISIHHRPVGELIREYAEKIAYTENTGYLLHKAWSALR